MSVSQFCCCCWFCFFFFPPLKFSLHCMLLLRGNIPPEAIKVKAGLQQKYFKILKIKQVLNVQVNWSCDFLCLIRQRCQKRRQIQRAQLGSMDELRVFLKLIIFSEHMGLCTSTNQHVTSQVDPHQLSLLCHEYIHRCSLT